MSQPTLTSDKFQQVSILTMLVKYEDLLERLQKQGDELALASRLAILELEQQVIVREHQKAAMAQKLAQLNQELLSTVDLGKVV